MTQAPSPDELTEALRSAHPELADVEVDEVDIHPHVPARFYRGPASTGRPLLVWAHGGGFVGGDLDMAEANWVGLAVAARQLNVLSLDYRKAVNGTTYPIPMEDVLTGWLWAAQHADKLAVGSLHLGGASAGGALAAGTALKLRDSGGLQPASLVLVYPTLHRELPAWTPQELEGLREAAGTTTYFSPSGIREMGENYLGDGGPDHGRYAFPGEADLNGLPPHLMLLADKDTLRSSGEAYAASLNACGVTQRSHCEPGTKHGFLNAPDGPGANSGIEAIADWMHEF